MWVKKLLLVPQNIEDEENEGEEIEDNLKDWTLIHRKLEKFSVQMEA